MNIKASSGMNTITFNRQFCMILLKRGRENRFF